MSRGDVTGRSCERVRATSLEEPPGSVLPVTAGRDAPVPGPVRVQPEPSVLLACTGSEKATDICRRPTVLADVMTGGLPGWLPWISTSWFALSEPGAPGDGSTGTMGTPVRASAMDAPKGAASAPVPE